MVPLTTTVFNRTFINSLNDRFHRERINPVKFVLCPSEALSSLFGSGVSLVARLRDCGDGRHA